MLFCFDCFGFFDEINDKIICKGLLSCFLSCLKLLFIGRKLKKFMGYLILVEKEEIIIKKFEKVGE